MRTKQWSFAAAFLTLGSSVAHGAVLNSLGELSAQEKFDFIIVGSGPGGATLASRLTENPRFKVLLVEAGPNNEGILNITIPARHGSVNTVYSWEYPSVPQPGLNNRTVVYNQGRVLGGSSSINGQVYTRGSSDDFDHLAKLTGDKGWAWKNVLPYMKKTERWVPPPGGRTNTTGQFDPKVHGFNGQVSTSLSWNGVNDFTTTCLQRASTTNDAAFKFNLDYNSGRPIGLGWTPYTIGNGERSSSASSFLPPSVRSRPNLTILVNTYALRVLPVGKKGSLDFRTVELGTVSGAPTKKLTASKEAIIAAGAFGSPQILLNSGIGDGKELKQVGVAVTHHLPDVGKNLNDHLGIQSLWVDPSPPLPVPDPETALLQWQVNRTGPLTEPFAVWQIMWSRIPSNAALWRKYKDPAPGPTSPHIEIIPVGTLGGVIGGVPILLTPYSRGTVKLASSDPFQLPLIDHGFLTHPFDVEAIKESVRLVQRFFSGPLWEGKLGPFISPDPDTPSFEQQLRDQASWVWHPVGTTAMSAKNAKNGVLDPDLKVKGVKGLRVVGASSFPKVPAAHTQAPVYALAERVADLIKAAYAK